MGIEDFEIGHVAQLTAGGPLMTVHQIEPDNPDGAIVCVWFDPNWVLLETRFNPDELRIVRKR